MFKELVVHANFNERTGYGIHASRFFPELDKLVRKNGGSGTVHISLLDTVTVSNTTERWPSPSILYNVWESTEQPQSFLDKLSLYDQMWVPSEWQRAASIAQGVPEEFIKVVPEGVDPDTYHTIKELPNPLIFTFVHVGQWQPRKSTLEIIQAFLKAFPTQQDVRLELSVDTLFPSDTYKTTEERLEAYGINDPRIRVIHFEERTDYVRRLQKANAFVSCSRAEGWGLPIIEAMACGIPTIVADWGGSTEYATDAIRIPVTKLIKPFGIYGNWDVPGQWCEPDFDILVKSMQEVVERYDIAKANALKSSERIRKDFTWARAAEKAYGFLGELHEKFGGTDNEDSVKEFARKKGYDVALKKIPAAFVIGCWPDSPEKEETLKETISQVKAFGDTVIITTHYALSPEITKLADFVLYEKKNVLSGDWKPTYFRVHPGGRPETKESSIQYHGVACLNAMRNAIDFCRGKFSKMYYIEYDAEVDLNTFVEECRASVLPFTGVKYEGRWMRTDIWGADVDFIDGIMPRVSSWEEYVAPLKDINAEYPLEVWLYNLMPKDKINLLDFPVTNRYDQVDRNIWDTDMFDCNFFDGPALNIQGVSKKEYDVNFSIGSRNVYTVKQKAGMWAKASVKFYQPWTVTAKLDGVEVFRHSLNLTGRVVLVAFGSKALGDTIAWMPYVDEFRKAHKCHVICSSWWGEIFEYPEIEFVKPGTEVKNLYAIYHVGCFDNQQDKNPLDWRTIPLQKVASDILGLEYAPLRARLKVKAPEKAVKPYVCFSEHSTMQNKYWNRPMAWQNTINHLVAKGYECRSISFEKTTMHNVTEHNGQGIYETINDMLNCEFYIGLNHGPAWIAYALGKPCIMITGVSEPWNDFPNPHRVAVDVCRPGCFNDPSLPIDRKWDWCPRNKQYVCTAAITEDMVFEHINQIIGGKDASDNKKKERRKVRGIDAKRGKVKGDDAGKGQVSGAVA